MTSHHDGFAADERICVTPSSAPILFGDLNAYRASPIRVVTVDISGAVTATPFQRINTTTAAK